jgi:hypothetical protein
LPESGIQLFFFVFLVSLSAFFSVKNSAVVLEIDLMWVGGGRRSKF